MCSMMLKMQRERDIRYIHLEGRNAVVVYVSHLVIGESSANLVIDFKS